MEVRAALRRGPGLGLLPRGVAQRQARDPGEQQQRGPEGDGRGEEPPAPPAPLLSLYRVTR